MTQNMPHLHGEPPAGEAVLYLVVTVSHRGYLVSPVYKGEWHDELVYADSDQEDAQRWIDRNIPIEHRSRYGVRRSWAVLNEGAP